MNASRPVSENEFSKSDSSVSSPSLKVQERRIDSLILCTTNPRNHSPRQIRQLACAIKKFGFCVPVLVDANSNVIAGHGRLAACRQLGMVVVPVIELDHLTEQQARAFMIGDNKLTLNADWNETLLAAHFTELAALDLDFDLDVTGFSMGEIDLLIEGVQNAKADSADEITDPVEGPAVTRRGDLWLLGKHRLLCGDALNSDDFATLMNRKRAAIVFTDPPYNVPVDGHVSGLGAFHHRDFAMAAGELSREEFVAFLSRVFRHLASHSCDGALHFVCMDWRHMAEMMQAGESQYSSLLNLCVWAKDNAGMGSFYRSQHELVFVWKSGTASHRNNVELGRHGRHRSNIWNYPGVNSFAGRSAEDSKALALHPTVKPVALVADALLDASARGDIVLDAFVGSGTTLLASERVGRVCYGMELDPVYVDTAIRRWQRWTGQTARRADGVSFNSLSEVSRG